MENIKIPTAQEIYEQNLGGLYFSNELGPEDVIAEMKNFARLHLENFAKHILSPGLLKELLEEVK
jgi:hypothetical protein